MDPILKEKFYSIKNELKRAQEAERQIMNSYGIKVIEKVVVILFITGLVFISGAIGNHWLIKSVGMLMAGATALLAIYPYKAADWAVIQDVALFFFNGKIEKDIDSACHQVASRLKSYGAVTFKEMKSAGFFDAAEKAEEFVSKFG